MSDHVWYICPPDCGGCQYCLGGLAFCIVCRKGEGELEDDCPGEALKGEDDD